jgi:hypothetical protein
MLEQNIFHSLFSWLKKNDPPIKVIARVAFFLITASDERKFG